MVCRRLVTWILWPLVVCLVPWIRRHEHRILVSGRRLLPTEQNLAARAGVVDPDRIRVLSVKLIPMPGPEWLRQWARRMHFPAGAAAGMSLRYGIYLSLDYEHRLDVLVHECVHTAQYESLGMRRFLSAYVSQCLIDGYRQAPLEMEAVRISSLLSQC